MTTLTSLSSSNDEQVEDGIARADTIPHGISNNSSQASTSTTINSSTQEDSTTDTDVLSRYQRRNPLRQQEQQLKRQLVQVREQVMMLKRELHALKTQSSNAIVTSTPDSTHSDETDLARMLLMENDYNMYFAAIKRTKKKKQKAIRSESMEKLLMAEHHLTTLTKENELKWAANLAKVQFDDIKSSIELQDNQVYKRIYQISGHTINEGFPFNVLLHARETDKSILVLKLDVGRKMQLEMQPYLTEIETKHQLIRFFRMVVDYARLDRSRYRTFRMLIYKYIDIWQQSLDELPQQQMSTEWTNPLPTSMVEQAAKQVTLQFNGPGASYPKLIFIWEMHVNDYGYITPHVQLMMEVSPTALHQHDDDDDDDSIRHMPEQFERLVKQHGHLSAMKEVIELCYRSST